MEIKNIFHQYFPIYLLITIKVPSAEILKADTLKSPFKNKADRHKLTKKADKICYTFC